MRTRKSAGIPHSFCICVWNVAVFMDTSAAILASMKQLKQIKKEALLHGNCMLTYYDLRCSDVGQRY